MTEAPHAPAFPLGSMRVSAVFDQNQIVLAAKFGKAIKIRGTAAKVYEDNRTRSFGDCGLNQCRIQIDRVRIHIHEHWHCADAGNRRGRSHECNWWLRPLRLPASAQCQCSWMWIRTRSN